MYFCLSRVIIILYENHVLLHMNYMYILLHMKIDPNTITSNIIIFMFTIVTYYFMSYDYIFISILFLDIMTTSIF